MVFIFCSCQKKTNNNVYQPGPLNGKDAVISEGYGRINFSKIDRIHLLALTIEDTISNNSRFLIRIGFSDISFQTEIDSAFLHLSVIKPGHFGEDNTYQIGLIKDAWLNEKVNWNNQPKIFETPIITVPNSKEKFSNKKINVLPFVKKIINGEAPNFGFLFKLNKEEKPYKGVRYYSSDAKDESKRPKLEIFFK